MFCIDTPKKNDIQEIEKLLDISFGEDRQNKTVYRLRDGVDCVQDLFFVGRYDGALIASLQFWPVMIKTAAQDHDALLLGPIAIADQYRGQGFGVSLMRHGLETARKLGHVRVILVGDASYYRKMGFCRDLARGLSLPGPVDYDRLLGQALVPRAFDGICGQIVKIK